VFYVNAQLEKLMLDELRNACRPGMVGGFLPGVKQIANVAALPGKGAVKGAASKKFEMGLFLIYC
jgi:hypothetical protein